MSDCRFGFLPVNCPDPDPVPFYLSHVGTGKPTKTFCVTVNAPMTSLKLSIINFIS